MKERQMIAVAVSLLDARSSFPLRSPFVLAGAALLFAISGPLRAQGILTVTPSATASTIAGTGAVGYTGDGAAAAAATLACPSGVAYDASGNLYFADSLNHVVREVAKGGTITTVAGTGVEGFGGDGGAATAAQLDTPTGVAVDASGNLYIADSHNQRVRRVSGGTITTIAGTGVAGFAGDGGAATSALLSLPSGVAVDAGGNIYIADTNNQRVRKIAGGTIATIAGDGEELFAGDGAAATSGALDLPTGVAVDGGGNVYIADRHNQRMRMVAPGGTISTVAGSGAASFAGGFSGDGASAAAALLARPSGVSVDGAGNIYIADTDNERVRRVSGGTVATVAGGGLQGFGGDGGAAVGAILNSPKAIAADALGDVAIADRMNQRVRVETLPTLTFANDGVGILSAAQSVTLANTGSAAITVSSTALTGAFTTAPGGTCSAAPILLAAGGSCTEDVAFLPTAAGAASGSVLFGGTGVVGQSILLAGTAVQAATTSTLISSSAPGFAGQAITFTEVVKPAGLGTPTGSVTFFDGTTVIGSATLSAGSASVTTAVATGTNSITAVYAGDSNFTGDTSGPLAETIYDFSVAVGSGVLASQTVEPGAKATYGFNLTPVGGAFPFSITLSVTGLPPGATATLTPQGIASGASPAGFALTVQTAANGAALDRRGGGRGDGYGGGTIALGLLLVPFGGWMRRRHGRLRAGLRAGTLCAIALVGLFAVAGLTGCGAGFFGQIQQTYTVNVTGTATGAGGAMLQHTAPVMLTVQ